MTWCYQRRHSSFDWRILIARTASCWPEHGNTLYSERILKVEGILRRPKQNEVAATWLSMWPGAIRLGTIAETRIKACDHKSHIQQLTLTQIIRNPPSFYFPPFLHFLFQTTMGLSNSAEPNGRQQSRTKAKTLRQKKKEAKLAIKRRMSRLGTVRKAVQNHRENTMKAMCMLR